MKENKAVRQYCRAIGRQIAVPRREKRRMLDQIRQMCRSYLEEYPHGDCDALAARFGAPEQIAAAFLEEMEPAAVLDGFRLRRRVLGITAAALAAVVLVWMLAVGGALVNEVRHADGYYDVAVYRD